MKKPTEKQILSEMSDDDKFKAKVRRAKTPAEVLSFWVYAADQGWLSDPYYRDLVDEIAKRSEELFGKSMRNAVRNLKSPSLKIPQKLARRAGLEPATF